MDVLQSQDTWITSDNKIKLFPPILRLLYTRVSTFHAAQMDTFQVIPTVGDGVGAGVACSTPSGASSGKPAHPGASHGHESDTMEYNMQENQKAVLGIANKKADDFFGTHELVRTMNVKNKTIEQAG